MKQIRIFFRPVYDPCSSDHHEKQRNKGKPPEFPYIVVPGFPGQERQDKTNDSTGKNKVIWICYKKNYVL